MYRFSEEMYTKLGKEMLKAFKKEEQAKQRGEEPDYKHFNALFMLDCKIRDAIQEGLQNIEEKGWFN